MKVFMVGYYQPAPGGVFIHVKRLKQRLLEKGILVELATLPGSLCEAIDDQAEYRLWWRGIAKKAVLGKYDVIHIHTAGGRIAKLLKFASFRMGGAKLVVTFHSFRVSTNSGITKNKFTLHSNLQDIGRSDWLGVPNSWDYKLIAPPLFSTIINHIVCVSSTLKDTMLKYKFPAQKISVISPYLPPPLLEQDRLAISPDVWKFVASHHPILTANACHLVWYQGQDLYGLDLCVQLCHALIKDYPNLGFIFALPTIKDEAYFAEIKDKIKALKLENAFLFTHCQAEYWPIIEQSDLFIRPTNSDGFSLSVAEAIDLNTPAIASDVCPRPPGTILFQNRNFSDLLTKTKDVLSNLNEHKKRLEDISVLKIDPASQIIDIYNRLNN